MWRRPAIDGKASFSIRNATEADQPVITAIIHEAHLNPRNLDWPRFIVAETGGQVIGVGQVKPHDDGSRELASIAVNPDFQGQGVGTAICQALIERENGILFLMTRAELEPYYARFGFGKVNSSEVTPYFRRILRLTGVFKGLMRRVMGTYLIVMKRPPGG